MLIFTAAHFFCAMFLLHVFIALLLVVMIMPTMSVAFCMFGCSQKSPSDQIQAAIEGCPLQCGRGTGLSSKKETFFRVMGGDPVEEVDWPWTFRLETTDAACPGETYTCTATLYSNKFLLTAGHCLFKNVYACKPHPSGKAKIINVAYQPSELRVIRKGEAYSVRNVWVTPDFDENSARKERFVGDLGIIEIDTEVAFEPLCWSSTLRRESTPVAHLVGWSAHEVDANGRAIGGGELRHAEVALALVQNCRDAWGQRATLCAGSGGSGALEGDSGSALIVREFGLHFGIGLLSSYWQGMDRDQKADVYVPVSKYCSFIREVTGQECADANNVPIACVTSEGTRTDDVANV